MLIDNLIIYSQLSKKELNEIIEFSPYHYKEFKIHKKNKKEYRIIHQPQKETKFLQYYLLNSFFNKFNICDDVAKAYIKGKKNPLKEQAKLHYKYKHSLHLDFKDFFHCITFDMLETEIKKQNIECTKEDLQIIKKLSFRSINNCWYLSIGSPVSPIISNIVLLNFDKDCFNFINTLGGSVTRYSDDIWYSSNDREMLKAFNLFIKKLLVKHFNNKIKLNDSKTKFFYSNKPRRITGLLVVTENNKNSIKVPRNIKREIRTLLYKKNLTTKELAVLRGYMSYLYDNEPEYINKLVVKYPENYKKRIF